MLITGEVRYQLDGDSASLKFRETDAEFFVDTVFVPGRHRSKGVGTELMRRVLDLADLAGKPVKLVARPLGNSTVEVFERLIRYYEGLGFAVTAKATFTADMERPPRSAALPRAGSGAA